MWFHLYAKVYMYVFLCWCTDVWFQNFKSKLGFIATQMPLPDTREDLWRLQYDRSSKTIVMLNELVEGDKVHVFVAVMTYRTLSQIFEFCTPMDTCTVVVRPRNSLKSAAHCLDLAQLIACQFFQTCLPYWPSEVGSCVTYDDFEVTLKAEETSHVVDCLTIREFAVNNTSNKSAEALTVKQFQLSSWPESSELPAGIDVIIDLIEAVEKWQQTSGNTSITVHCMLVHCASRYYHGRRQGRPGGGAGSFCWKLKIQNLSSLKKFLPAPMDSTINSLFAQLLTRLHNVSSFCILHASIVNCL